MFSCLSVEKNVKAYFSDLRTRIFKSEKNTKIIFSNTVQNQSTVFLLQLLLLLMLAHLIKTVR